MGGDRLRVVIAGGGVAALEAGLALQDLAGERVSVTFIAPNPEFVYRPMVVREPFGLSAARRYPLDEIVRDLGAELVADRFERVEPDSQIVHTEAGGAHHYDALLLALGALMRPRFEHAITLDDRQLDAQLHGLVQDVEGGYVRSLAFLVPDPVPWPFPAYELALMTAGRAQEVGMDLAVTVVTPEDAPLAVFGAPASQAVAELLAENGVNTLTSAHAEVSAPGRISIRPGGQVLEVDRIVALPQLYGPATPGIPKNAPDGFLSVDSHSRVTGVEGVYAAGDATDFPLKYGGIAAQQADAAAQAIAALAGSDLEPRPLAPVIHGMLLGGPKPLYLSAHLTGGHGSSSTISENPPDDQAAKIEARYLAPYLIQLDRKRGAGR
jgi:sulfide:quinone oxidoreductase